MPKIKHAKTGHVAEVTEAQAKVIQRDPDWKSAPDSAGVGPGKPTTKDGDK
jgi:hypothetical protein